ncbi:MAG: type II toxin-antitoxin system RelE/ParE family toxin [Bacteroidales bacterium]|nr:type II toxin-antitoxin system RelE/ParE family toxin [Bacteroidales bacterium]
MYNVILTRDAQTDRLQVMDWYETILSRLAQEFYEEVSQKVENIVAKYPKIAPVIHKNVRKLSLSRFPYNLIYVVDDAKKEVQILAVVHDKRDPSIWQSRV